MNQGIAFARTLRALDADDFRASRLGLLAAAGLLAAWTWWMLAARLPQYESTTNVRVAPGRAIAYFPSDAVSHMRTGQPAILRFSSQAFPAQLQTIAPDHVELVFTTGQPPANALIPATAEVETSRISPAAIALRTLR
jgi:hypothetical protein